MIFIHATAYFLNVPIVHLLWDYAHFSVPLFVFCSVFIAFQKKDATAISITSVITRIKRLVVPYYIFVAALFAMTYFVLHKPISLSDISSWLMFGSGRDLGWLVVLFLYILFLIPLIVRISKYAKLSKLLFQIAILSTIVLLFAPPLPYFRFIMWLPWSVFLASIFWFVQHIKGRWTFLYISLLSLVGFLVSRYILLQIDHTLTLTENKYPPNLYYVSYGVLMTTVIYWLHQAADKAHVVPSGITKVFNFMSAYSYSLFFIHFLFVILFVALDWHNILGPWWFFIFLTIASSTVQIGLNGVLKRSTASQH